MARGTVVGRRAGRYSKGICDPTLRGRVGIDPCNFHTRFT